MDAVLQQLLEHRDELLAYLRREGAGAAEAEDLFQTAIARGLEPWAAPPALERALPWFRRVLRNALVDQVRRATAARRALERQAGDPTAIEPEVAPRRVCRCTQAALAALKPEYGALVQWIDVDGLAVDEAARRAGITANNAYVRLHRARRALRERLEAMCGECATGGGGRCSDCYCQPEARV